MMNWTNELIRFSHLIWTHYTKKGDPYYRFVATTVDGDMREWTTRKGAAADRCCLEFIDEGDVLEVTWHQATSGKWIVDKWESSENVGADLEAAFEALVESRTLDKSVDGDVTSQRPLRI